MSEKPQKSDSADYSKTLFLPQTEFPMRAGLPQLVRPQAYDQFDNARRLIDLGVARELLPANYRADRAAKALTTLLGDAALRARCQALAPRLQGPGQAMARACEAILARCAPQLATA